MSRPSVVVVGAGVSGLAAAWELTGGVAGPTANSPYVEVIDANDRVGGSLATTSFAGRTIDLGADGYLARRPEATTLVNELGLSDQLEEIAAAGASVWLRGALRDLPDGLVLGVPTRLRALTRMGGLGPGARLAAWRDYYAPRRYRLDADADATIGEIVRAKLGRELTYSLIEPMVGGIQAGRIDELSATSVFPALLDAARHGGSLMKAMARRASPTPGPTPPPPVAGPTFLTLVGGVGSLPNVLAQRLAERGVEVRLASPVRALRPANASAHRWEVDTAHATTPAHAVVLATPGAVAATLAGASNPAINELSSLRVAGAAMITFSLSTDTILPARGTGVLVPLGTPGPHGESLLITAVTFLDRKWPHLRRDGDVLVRVHVGRSDDARWRELDDDALRERVADELRVLLPTCGAVRESLVQRWPQALTQYTLGHEGRVARAREAAGHLGLWLAGGAYDGVGVPASIGSGAARGP